MERQQTEPDINYMSNLCTQSLVYIIVFVSQKFVLFVWSRFVCCQIRHYKMQQKHAMKLSRSENKLHCKFVHAVIIHCGFGSEQFRFCLVTSCLLPNQTLQNAVQIQNEYMSMRPVAIVQLVQWLLNRMPATCWQVLVRTGFESRWGRISVAVPMVYQAMLNL